MFSGSFDIPNERQAENSHLVNLVHVNKSKDAEQGSVSTPIPIIKPELMEEQRILTADEMAHQGNFLDQAIHEETHRGQHGLRYQSIVCIHGSDCRVSIIRTLVCPAVTCKPVNE